MSDPANSQSPAEDPGHQHQPNLPVPSIGRIVHYMLTEQDATAINRRRADASTYQAADRHDGAQVHVGNPAVAGEVYPMMIVRVWGSEVDSMVNGKVFLDGNDELWVTSVKDCVSHMGPQPGTFVWPQRG